MCLGGKRIYVFDEVYDELMEQLTRTVAKYEPGLGWEKAEKPNIRVGPLHTSDGRDELMEQLQDALDGGGELVLGGDEPDGNGYFMHPTIVTNPALDSRVAREETFGPVLPIWRVCDLDEAIALRQRLRVRPRRVGVDQRHPDHQPRRQRGRRRDEVGQPVPLRLRRAAVRRRQAVRLRQGARHGGPRLLPRGHLRRRSEGSSTMAVTFARRRAPSATSRSTSRPRTPTTRTSWRSSARRSTPPRPTTPSRS